MFHIGKLLKSSKTTIRKFSYTPNFRRHLRSWELFKWHLAPSAIPSFNFLYFDDMKSYGESIWYPFCIFFGSRNASPLALLSSPSDEIAYSSTLKKNIRSLLSQIKFKQLRNNARFSKKILEISENESLHLTHIHNQIRKSCSNTKHPADGTAMATHILYISITQCLFVKLFNIKPIFPVPTV